MQKCRNAETRHIRVSSIQIIDMYIEKEYWHIILLAKCKILLDFILFVSK